MEPSAPPPPASIGRFRIDSTLGSGGMGAVYKAFDPTLQRTVALKTVRPDINRQDYLDRLYREAQACARLKHPNVVTVYEAGEVGGLVYMVMEYLDGEDLAKAIQRGGFTFDVKARILIQILEALQHAHDNDVIHRDIKPSNVYRQPDGSIKVVDFGLARVIQADALTTGSGMVMGTAHYASPEQLKGLRNIDHRTDLYSAGVLAYEMFSGRRPFQTDDGSVMSVMLRVMNDPTPPMNMALTKAFPQIERMVTRAMEKSPDDRYQTAAEMRNELRAFVAASGDAVKASERRLAGEGSVFDDELTSIVPPDAGRAVAKTSSNRFVWAGAAVAALAILTVGATFSRSGNQEPQPFPAPPAVGTPSAGSEAATIPPPAQTSQTEPANGPAQPLRIVANNSQPPATTPPPIAAIPPATTAASEPATAADEDPRARQVFISPDASAAGLRYRLIKRAPGGGEVDIDPSAAIFKTGDQVRFTFKSNIDGYLYVVQLGSSGNWSMLFPHPEINGGRNTIRRGEEHIVPPNADEGFEFRGTPGTEQVFIFLSKDPLDQLPGLNTFDQPAKINSRAVETLRGQIRSRDLIFVKDRSRTPQGATAVTATYVANRAEIGKAVAASFTLDHRR